MKRVPSRRALLKGIAVALVLFTGFLAVPPPLMEDVSFSRAVFARDGSLMRLTTSKDEKYRLFVPLTEISEPLKEAVLLHEDQYFYSHVGINPASLFRAFVQTYLSGGRRVGASTISMQLARLKFDIHTRHIPGKLWQMVRALQLELHYSKDELFEAYLNLAPYGYNIEGVGAASLVYFNKKPESLTLPEAITLAVIPQSPARRSPDAANPGKEALTKARNTLFAKWVEKHPDAQKDSIYFKLPLLAGSIRQMPFTAPHLVQDMLSKNNDGMITTTVDARLQKNLEKLLDGYVGDRKDIGVNNAAALLVDMRTMQAVASIGSADFLNASIKGQVDGTKARRSPGSALKPFIYALALQQGLIHPRTLLSDSPSTYGAYNPENFDRDFGGPIFAVDALRLSRNIPALTLAAQLKRPNFFDWLKNAGIGGLKKQKDYGLSLVLGGAEVTLRDLVGLYAMLGNDGVWQPIAYTQDSKKVETKKLLTPEASFLALDMLKDTPRPFTKESGPEVYWKTGTSNAFRDAWTVGVFGHYALGVWVGNFEGKSNPAFIGVRTAAPLFFQMVGAVNAVEKQENLVAQKAPRLKIAQADVCAATGDVGDRECPVRVKSWFIPGVSPLLRYDVYRAVLVDKLTGLRACRFDADMTEYRTYEFWPADMLRMLEKAGIRKTSAPAFMAGCEGSPKAHAGLAPKITSPSSVVDYTVRLNEEKDNDIVMRASADGDVQSIFWFLDDSYLGQSSPKQDFLWRGKPGRYTLRVVDDKGRSHQTAFNVMVAE